jgi:predicted metal-dependent hydrolase
MGKIVCKIRRSKRAKRVSLRIDADGSVVAVAPRGASKQSIIEFAKSQLAWIKKHRGRMLSTKRSPDISIDSKEHFASHKPDALAFVEARILYFSSIHSFRVNTVRVKKLKTQWGSCSVRRNLNFNYKILFLPEHLQDYLIVHELCHLHELNHSKKFWAHVEAILPDHKERRKELRKIYF